MAIQQILVIPMITVTIMFYQRGEVNLSTLIQLEWDWSVLQPIDLVVDKECPEGYENFFSLTWGGNEKVCRVEDEFEKWTYRCVDGTIYENEPVE